MPYITSYYKVISGQYSVITQYLRRLLVYCGNNTEHRLYIAPFPRYYRIYSVHHFL